MVDRVPEHPGRVRLIPVPGEDNLYDLVREDGATVEGTPLCKGTLLPDEVCNTLGLNSTTAVPADAWMAIPAVLGMATLMLTVKHVDGTPYSNLKINGLTGIDASRCYTNTNGQLFLFIAEGTYTLSISESFIDSSMASKTVTAKAGQTSVVTMQETSNTVKSLTITSTRTIKFSRNVTGVDVFCVGGGGGGAGSTYYSEKQYGGGGGGGGHTATKLNITPTAGASYTATIGSGGSGGKGVTGRDSIGNGGSGGTTSFMGVSAPGGSGGYCLTMSMRGGYGGSGGGVGAFYNTSSSRSSAGAGGTDGGSGGGDDEGNGGGGSVGQTTRAFGESSGALYAGGGGGGGANRDGGNWSVSPGAAGAGGGGAGGAATGASGVANTGGGGGGGGITTFDATHINNGGNGGSGVVLIRWRTRV